MKKSIIILLLILGLSLIGCNGFMFHTKGSGNNIEKNIEINSSFSAVKISNHGNLFVTIGDEVKLKLEGDDNIIPHIIAKITDNMLIIKSDKELRSGFKSKIGIKYHLTVKKGQLNQLIASSHGDIHISELTADKVKISLSSHGDIVVGNIKSKKAHFHLSSHGDLKVKQIVGDFIYAKLSSHGNAKIISGVVKNQELFLSSHGDYLAKGLESEKCKVVNNSHGKIIVYVTELITGRISGHGDLYYRGNPKLETSKGSHATVKSLD